MIWHLVSENTITKSILYRFYFTTRQHTDTPLKLTLGGLKPVWWETITVYNSMSPSLPQQLCKQLLHLYGNRAADEHEPVIVSVKTCQRLRLAPATVGFLQLQMHLLWLKDYVWTTSLYSHSSNSRWEVICTIVCKIRHWQCSHITLCTIIRWNQTRLLFQSSVGQQLQYRNCRLYGNVYHMVMLIIIMVNMYTWTSNNKYIAMVIWE